ncbi:MAG: YjdF family protein [Bullifex sp.]
MDRDSMVMAVFFESPFWVCVFERIRDGKLSVARVVFGAEPGDREILNFLSDHWTELRFSPAVATAVKKASVNPKRSIREARKQVLETGIGTKSQQTLKARQEQLKQERRSERRKRMEAEDRRTFELRQQKKHDKHRGH